MTAGAGVHFGPRTFLANAPWVFTTAMPLLTAWRLFDALVVTTDRVV